MEVCCRWGQTQEQSHREGRRGVGLKLGGRDDGKSPQPRAEPSRGRLKRYTCDVLSSAWSSRKALAVLEIKEQRAMHCEKGRGCQGAYKEGQD